MGTLADSLDRLAEAIRNLNPYSNPTIRIKNPEVGMRVGTCINCGQKVMLRQPWLSKMPIVNDGWYLIHCENKECHNFYGMELKENQMSIADFVNWDEEYIITGDNEKISEYGNVIPFRRAE